MTTLQVETKAFPTSIPNTISHDPVSPSSQFLSFYSASEGLGRAESISSPDEQGVPSQDIGPASRRVEAEKLASKPRVGAAASRSKAKPGRQNNFTRPLSQVEDVRSRYRDSNTYTFEQSGTIPFRPRVIPRYGPQQITKDVERREFRRPVREDSDLSIEEIRREFPVPALGSAEYEAWMRRLNGPASDSSSSSSDDIPIIISNRRRENRYTGYDPSPSPPPPKRLRSRVNPTWDRVLERTPSPPSQTLHTRVIKTRERAQPRSPSPPPAVRRRIGRDNTSKSRNGARLESIRNNGRLTERVTRSHSPPPERFRRERSIEREPISPTPS